MDDLGGGEKIECVEHVGVKVVGGGIEGGISSIVGMNGNGVIDVLVGVVSGWME